jgi:hypothetical protein
MAEKDSRITVDLGPELYGKVKRIAGGNHIAVSAQIRLLLGMSVKLTEHVYGKKEAASK